MLAAILGVWAIGPSRAQALAHRLSPASFDTLPGFAEDRLDEALKIFAKTCDRPVRGGKSVEGFDPAAQAKVCAAARNGEGAAG